MHARECPFEELIAFLIAEIVSVLLSLGFYARINKNIIAPMYSPAE